MSLSYGQTGLLIQDSHISSITNTNITTVNTNGNVGSGFVYSITTPGDGCTDNNGFVILLRDIIPWTKISYRVRFSGSGASCWAFNQGSSYGTSGHNILSWNSSIDKVTKCTNSFELSQFALKMNACDNNSNNFLHGSYRVGSYQEFTAIRRRDSMASLAGPAIGLQCNGAVTVKISEIIVWE